MVVFCLFPFSLTNQLGEASIIEEMMPAYPETGPCRVDYGFFFSLEIIPAGCWFESGKGK